MNPSLEAGSQKNHQQLFVALYDELRRLAQRKLRQGGAANSMGATTLLHEVYLTVHARDGVVFPDNARFLAYASRAMRGLIIDYARSRQALKRGAGFEITSLPTEVPEQGAASPTPTRGSLKWLTSSISVASRSPRLRRCGTCRSVPCSGIGRRRGYSC